MEKLRTRIVLAQSIDVSPDSVGTTLGPDDTILCFLDDFKGMNFVIGFDEIPTMEEAREDIKDCYLMGCEHDFDVEFGKESKPSI